MSFARQEWPDRSFRATPRGARDWLRWASGALSSCVIGALASFIVGGFVLLLFGVLLIAISGGPRHQLRSEYVLSLLLAPPIVAGCTLLAARLIWRARALPAARPSVAALSSASAIVTLAFLAGHTDSNVSFATRPAWIAAYLGAVTGISAVVVWIWASRDGRSRGTDAGQPPD